MLLETKRNITYDILKGLAIVLVVLGHTVQYLDPNFDNNFFFKIIYSFHMPLFFFISGAVLSIKHKNIVNKSPFYNFYGRVTNSLFRLFIPFLCWTIIIYFSTNKYISMSLLEWLNVVFHHIDYSLWFFIALLLCLNFFYIVEFIFEFFSFQKDFLFLVISSFIIFLLIIIIIPNIPGLAYLTLYYPYFIIGILWNVKKIDIFKIPLIKYMVLVFFLLLVSFWTRVENVFSNELIDILYRIITALSGIYITYNISIFIEKKVEYIKNIFIVLGTASLGIYAIHFNFIKMKPYFFMALAISLGIVFILRKSKLLGFLFLGENRFKRRKL